MRSTGGAGRRGDPRKPSISPGSSAADKVANGEFETSIWHDQIVGMAENILWPYKSPQIVAKPARAGMGYGY